MGNGKDVLFGWLVGRAAADLGLAQALAASEAQRAEQIKRLEESLIAQIRELQNQQKVGGAFESRAGELNDLKSELETFATRVGWLESAAQQTGQLKETLQAELAALQSQLSAGHNRLEVRHSSSERFAASVTEKIRELEDQLNDKARAAASAKAQFGQFESELRALVDRMSKVEFAAQQAQTAAASDARQAAVSLINAEIAALKSNLSEQQNNSQPADALIRALEENLRGKIHELQTQLTRERGGLEDRDTQLREFQSSLEALVQRIGQAESMAQQTQALVINETELAAQLRERQRTELTALEAQLDDSRAGVQARDSLIQGLEENLSAKIQNLQNQIGQKISFLEGRDAELREFRVEMQSLARRLDQVESASHQPATLVLNEAERAQWMKGVDEILSAKMGEMEDRLRQKLQNLENGTREMGEFKSELLRGLAERMSQVELATQQAQTSAATDAQRAQLVLASLNAEMAALKAKVSAQQHDQQPTDSLIRGLEETLCAKVQEIQNQLIQDQDCLLGRETELREVKSELQAMVQRMNQAESMAQQTHALFVNESELAAQLRDGLRTELAMLQAQFSEKQARDLSIQGLEEGLSAKIRELQNHVGQKLGLLDGRDVELSELKGELQTLTRQVAQMRSSSQASPPPAMHLAPGAAAPPLGTEALKAQREDRLSPKSPPPDHLSGKEGLLQSGDARKDNQVGVDREQVKELQERMSAEIERVRAELREKSGRWKVRR
jgi:chromosome segregation ATPase